MAGKLIYSEEALSHLNKLSDFLVRNAGELTASRIIDELMISFRILKDMPYMGREHPDPFLASRGYRIYISGKYVGVYLVIDEIVWMAGVYHTKTDWLTR